MKVVIQCAGTKNPMQSGSGFVTASGKSVQFVADPGLAPSNEIHAYVHPDDSSDGSQTWRERLIHYNETSAANPLQLLPAYKLYGNRVYENLVKEFGVKQVFILSAGWGLIAADFLTPHYDITFSKAKNVKPQCHRKKQDAYADLCHLPDDGDEIIFLGGKDYFPLFSQLTTPLKGKKKVFYNSNFGPALTPGFWSERFNSPRKTNWHYSCAQALIDKEIGI